jgi:hypothetical protein
VEIPKYDELSVVNLIADVMKQPDFAKFFPEQKTKADLPDRVYFFNILNTTDPGYVNAPPARAGAPFRWTGQGCREESHRGDRGMDQGAPSISFLL